MKKTTIAAGLAAIVILTAFAGGCTPKTPSPDDNTPIPVNPELSTGDPSSDKANAIVTFNPNAGVVGETNENGEQMIVSEFLRATYDSSITNPVYFFVDSYEDFQAHVESKGITLESNSKKGVYDEDFFSSHTVIMVALPYSSGSTTTTLETAELVDGTVKIQIASNSNNIGTADMATFYGIISIHNSILGEASGFEIHLNNQLVSEAGSVGTDK